MVIFLINLIIIHTLVLIIVNKAHSRKEGFIINLIITESIEVIVIFLMAFDNVIIVYVVMSFNLFIIVIL